MAKLKILTFGNNVLRAPAKKVEKVTPELSRLAQDMLETMYDAPGIGLAAPQIGRSIRLVVIDVAKEDQDPQPYIMFNPEIEPAQDSPEVDYEEGCLSVPEVYANVKRPERIHVRGLDEYGDPFEMRDVTGLLARCIQHEVDHLQGILFVDHISEADRSENKLALDKLARSNAKKT